MELNTPHGVRSGSSVWSVALGRGDLNHAYHGELRGEAVVVDLPGSKTLYMPLLSQQSHGQFGSAEIMKLPERVMSRAGLLQFKGGDPYQIIQSIANIRHAPVELKCSDEPDSDCPILSYFDDEGNPATFHVLNYGDISTVMGGGISLRRVTIQITKDRITTGIDARLPWLKKYADNHWALDGLSRTIFTGKEPVSARVDGGSFSTEVDYAACVNRAVRQWFRIGGCRAVEGVRYHPYADEEVAERTPASEGGISANHPLRPKIGVWSSDTREGPEWVGSEYCDAWRVRG